jgi:peptide/nickel transport system permease protein
MTGFPGQTGGDGTISGEIPPELIAEADSDHKAGLSPNQLAWRRLKRNRGAMASGAVFILLVLACLAAPLWANYVADRGPDDSPGGTETVMKGGEEVLILGLDGIPVGPTFRGEYFFGADSSGRDVMVRLLYGGRNSLIIGIGAALGTTIMAVFLGLLAGYFRGFTDGIIARFMDIIWAFPVILLGIALGVALAESGLTVGPLTLQSGSLWIPIVIIAVVYIPYMARPIRGEVLALREKEFIEAARAQGMGSMRIMFSEIFPNIVTLLIVFFPLMVANAILLEAALSFLGAGVQAPTPSWGTMLDDGVSRIITAPFLAVIPGAMLVATVLSLNAFGEGVRDALDPRAKLSIEG